MNQRTLKLPWIVGIGLLVAVGFVFRTEVAPHAGSSTHAASPSNEGTSRQKLSVLRVKVVNPSAGGIERTTTQPGTVESFDFADLFAKVSGYLSEQQIDIGDHVKRGQVLAVISAPELNEGLHQAEAELAQSKAQVQQMEARIVTAKADYAAAVAAIKRSDADLEHYTAARSFRKKQYERIKNLFDLKSIDERLVDEKLDQYEAAKAAENAANAAITTAQAQATAAKARITSAEADLEDARAKVKLSEAAVARAQVLVNYLQIVSPYDGVVTKRSFHVGDFIRAADQGGHEPLLSVARTDKMRVIVQVPERDVAYTEAGDESLVELDALAGKKFKSEVARIAYSEDHVTRSMRTEIDLPNPDNQLRDGMFGRVTIRLAHASSGMTLPSTSLVGDKEGKEFAVYIVRDDVASRVPVEIGHDDGVRVEIRSGLQPDDLVVLRPGSDLSDGVRVEAERSEATAINRH
jgi:RND family efflux transporter MFP subunit